MLFAWAMKTRHQWLKQVLYWSMVPVIVGVGYGGVYPFMVLTNRFIASTENELIVNGLQILSRPVFFLAMSFLGLFTLDKLFRYRTGPMVVFSLSRCHDDVSLGDIHLRRGMVIAEMRLGEVYNYAKYWPLRLKPSELPLFVFLDAYQGALNFIEQARSGQAPMDGSTPLMTTTIFLHTVREGLHRDLPVHVAEEARREKSLTYRLAVALSLRMNPFSPRIPDPGSGTKRVYFTAQSFLEMEDFFRQEAAKLTRITQRILDRKTRSNRSSEAEKDS